ncbi:zinc finger, C2H2 type [Opisthorchis viverrini]|uniref:Zinc finger, C2H2 type n=1 Tax=Opisthorchis viverrini TaxID=6198 RepID=A0A1S8WGV2_OPIVI|nr:zinc finger, C2H2 type [Opisthorchis viverrini]
MSTINSQGSRGRRRSKLHRMVQRSRINRTSSGRIPFDCTWILLSLMFLRNSAVAQNHSVSHETGLENARGPRDGMVSLQFAQASNATTTQHPPEDYGIPCEQTVTSEHASNPTERADRIYAHQCSVCGKTFPCMARLMRHQNSHNDHHDLQCDLCSNTYKYQANLRRHTKARHPEGTSSLRTKLLQKMNLTRKSTETGKNIILFFRPPAFEQNKLVILQMGPIEATFLKLMDSQTQVVSATTECSEQQFHPTKKKQYFIGGEFSMENLIVQLPDNMLTAISSGDLSGSGFAGSVNCCIL